MSGRTTVYEVRAAEGRLIATHHREDKPDGTKQVWWRKDGRNGLVGMPLADLPLYGSELLADLDEDELIVVAEGEKARDALQSVGIPAVGTVTGSSSIPGRAALEVLRDRRVALWPDADDPGREHMQRIAKALDGVAAEVLEYTWDEAPDKGDAADHPSVSSRDPKAVDRLLTDLEGSPRWAGERDGKGVGVLLSEVEPERVQWLWKDRIALGKLNLVDGDPGTGKSAVTTDLAARVSIGKRWPDGEECQAGGVVILSAEDGLADTIRPRFDAAGGNPEKAVALSTIPDSEGNERQVSIPEDLLAVEAAIRRVGAVLVVIDPLMAFLSGNVNSHRDQDVRRALAPLAKMAERTGSAVVIVRHLNKATGGDAIYRGGGSIGIIGAARSALLVAKDPEDDSRRILAPLKGNLSKPAPSLAFSLEEAEGGAVRVEWRGHTSYTAAALLSATTNDRQRDVLDEAKEFLREVLSDGPVSARDVQQEATAAGVSKRTLDRAKAALGVRSGRKGEDGKKGGGTWFWSLPENMVAEPEDWQPKAESSVTDAEESAYSSQIQGTGLRLPEEEPVESLNGAGNLKRDSGEVAEKVAALFKDPPEWMKDRVAEFDKLGAPERPFNSLATAIAHEIFGSPHRWREVLPEVRKRVKGQSTAHAMNREGTQT